MIGLRPGYGARMSEQPQTGPGTDVSAADLDADIEVSPDAKPATSDPDEFTDDGLGMGDGPDIQADADGAS